MRRQSGLAVVLMTAGSIGLLASPALAQDGDRDCPDFPSQAAAQRFFERQGPGDPHRLDADNDGIACETPGGRPEPEPTKQPEPQATKKPGKQKDEHQTPEGPVAAGAGGMADPSSPVLPTAGALAGTLLIGAGVAAARRRTS